MRKTNQDLKEELKNARIALNGLNKVRRQAEQVLKDQGYQLETRQDAARDLVRATREWGKQYMRVDYLQGRAAGLK